MSKKLQWVINAERPGNRLLDVAAKTLNSVEYRKWFEKYTVGEPKGNERFSSLEMKAMGLVGLYEVVSSDD